MKRELCWYPTIVSVVNKGDGKIYIDDEGYEYISLHTTREGAERMALTTFGYHFVTDLQHDGKIIFGVS